MGNEVQGGRDPRYVGGVRTIDQPFHLEASPDPAPVRIGVVDTGIVLTGGAPPTWSADRIKWDAGDVDESAPPADGNPSPITGHGTFVCGLILANAPHSKLWMKGVIDGTADSDHDEDVEVAAAITDLANRGIELINLSFGGTSGEWTPPQVIRDALDGLTTDIVVVAAAGNDGTRQHLFPASITPKHAKMVSVGAVDETGPIAEGQLPPVADFSNHWRELSVFVSGVGLIGPHVDGKTAVRSGTSFAAALVTGQIAAKAYSENLRVRQAADSLLENTRKISVHTVNGQHETPYLHTGAKVLLRDW